MGFNRRVHICCKIKHSLVHLNLQVCGDNRQAADSDGDEKTCPSACGGASCDSISSNIFSLKEHQTSMTLGRRNDISPNSFGVISGCAGPKGCTLSSEARLRDLLNDHRDVQNKLASVLQRSALVNNLVSGVRIYPMFFS